MSYLQYALKEQKIPTSKKTKEWHVGMIYSFINFDSKFDTDRKLTQLNLWKDYYCIVDKEKQKNSQHVTNPYGYSLGLDWVAYPLIEGKLEQLVGEYMVRELRKKCYVINKRARAKKLDQIFSMITEELLRDVNSELEQSLGFVPETENPDMELPEDLEEFLSSDFKTESEEISDIILEVVLESKKEKSKLKNLFLDFLVQDEVIATIDEDEGHPSITRRDIFETKFDWHPEKEIQNNPQYIVFDKFIPYNEILNNFDLTKDEEKVLKNYVATINSGKEYSVSGTGYNDEYVFSRWFKQDVGSLNVRCVEMRWISKKKIQVKVSQNKQTGKDIYMFLEDDYKPRKNEKVSHIWIDEKRFCIMVGPDLVLDYGVIPEKNFRVDDIKTDKILAVGLRRNYPNGFNIVRSAAAKLKQLQDFASEILFELRLAMRRNNGRVLVYDAAQIPKHFLKTGGYSNAMNRVMHHAKKDQFLIINSQDRNSRYAFNQFTSIDMSTKGLMQDLFNMLALIEDLASKFLGVTPQREGNIKAYETVQGTERSVAQSTARTEIFFQPFEVFVQYLLENLLMKGKHVYKENEITPYIFGDLKTKFLRTTDPFFNDDIGVYIGEGYKEQKKKANIDRAAEIALANAQTHELILELTKVLNADFSSEAEKILKRAVNAMAKLREQEQQAMQKAEETRQQGENQRTEAEHNLKREGYDKDIRVASIKSNSDAYKANTNADTQKRIKAAELEQKYVQDRNKSGSSQKK